MKSQKTYGRGHQRSRTTAFTSASMWDECSPVQERTCPADDSILQRRLRFELKAQAPERSILSPLSPNSPGWKHIDARKPAPTPKPNPIPATPRKIFKSRVESLVAACSQPSQPFDEYMAKILPNASVRKLGEASYSEVFSVRPVGMEDYVLKVVPLDTQYYNVTIEDQAQQIEQEITILKLMSSENGFVAFRGACMVHGTYPPKLRECWNAYAAEKGSESPDPSVYTAEQEYCVLALQNGGTDLEHFEVSCWTQAQAIFWSVASILWNAESSHQFEHRDLHWGNIVIRERVSPEALLERLSLSPRKSARSFDLQVSLIDFTLSRASLRDGKTAYTELVDPELFSGRGLYQYDVYRFMRDAVVGSGDLGWSAYKPQTNVFWLHYLSDILLHHKGLKGVTTRRGSRNATYSKDEASAYTALLTINKALHPRKRRFGKFGSHEKQFESAAGVVQWGIGQGFEGLERH